MFASKNQLFTTPSGYQIQRSLRFRSSATAYLSRTPASTTNQKTWTWSAWVKRGQLSGSADFTLFGSVNPGVSQTTVSFSNDSFVVSSSGSGLAGINLKTSAVFRDPSAWYHIVVAVDTTQATDTNRVKIYINGVQSTSFSASTYPTQNTNCTLNVSGLEVNIARFNLVAFFQYFDGYLAELNFIDGQALTPSSFGAINPVTGVWSATKYAGTYGTNGFYLNFTDNSAATATTIGKDYSGNGNNWTPNNISVTAGVTYDSMLDVPLGAGGGERGNYAVMNPLDAVALTSVTEGNLYASLTASGSANVRSSLAVTSGKWYWEVLFGSTGDTLMVGVCDASVSNANSLWSTTNAWMYYSNNGNKYNSSSAAYGATFTNGDVIGVALDMDAGTLTFYKNNTSQGVAYNSGLTGKTLTPTIQSAARALTAYFNAGQRPFSYTPPTGFKALHTGNLAAPVIALPAQNMAATLYTGNSSTQTISNAVNGVSFQPDWVWIKSRSNTLNSGLMDSVRGPTKLLISNATNAEQTLTDELTSFNSNGFSLGVSSNGYTNYSPYTYVAWQWKAGGTAVTNTAGSITSSVSANVSAGFSVVTYTGNGTSGATFGHGLGATPSMVIVKIRNAAANWVVYHSRLNGGVTPQNYYLYLSTTNAEAAYAQHWNNTAPTSSLITLGNDGSVNGSSNTFVAYCFTPVAGYSAFGSYTGNGSADGPFLYFGFRPALIIVKSSTEVDSWRMYDKSRLGYNPNNYVLYPNLSNAEGASTDHFDLVSNGAKIRSNNNNTSGQTYIYAAFAENPFKNSLAR